MGGCRCTYRNCTVRSNGFTHMFHYPVFEKVRCHQWLTNANRLEFLNLKVSQLKNRVVCQHHFEEHWFMNFKKDKLKIEAVPTLNGPFCSERDKAIPTNDKMLPITLEEIENELLTCTDKRATFSVKYVDFLTNNEAEDVDLSNNNKQIQIKDSIYKHNDTEYSTRKLRSSKSKIQKLPQDNNKNEEKKEKENYDVTLLQDPIIVSVDFMPYTNEKENTNIVEIKVTKKDVLHETSIPTCSTTSMETNTKEIMSSSHNHNIYQNISSNNMPSLELEHPQSNQVEIKPKNMNKDKKIKILEERKLSSFVPPIPKYLKPLSPSGILRLPIKKTISNADNISRKDADTKINNVSTTTTTPTPVAGPSIDLIPDQDIKTKIDINPNIDYVHGIYTDPVTPKSEEKEGNELTLNTQNEIQIGDQATKSKKVLRSSERSLLKSKVNAEQLASINEKRKFNMKLRDVIESCLDSTVKDKDNYKEDNTKIVNKNSIKIKDNTDKEKSSKKETMNKLKNSTVKSLLSKDPYLPSVGEYSIAFLEARMKRMEDILLNRIDQNSQRIVELKNTIGKSQTKSVQTQTQHNEESYKKFLFYEISKYLTSDTKNLIYEDLFIRSSVPEKVSPSPRKRRRR